MSGGNNSSKVICFCFNITYDDVGKYAIGNNIETSEEIAELAKITKACSACRYDVLILFNSLRKNLEQR